MSVLDSKFGRICLWCTWTALMATATVTGLVMIWVVII